MDTRILVISGPTASGKSWLANELLNQCRNVVIVNADSMQVYKDLPVLSAQPDDCKHLDKYQMYGFLDFHENCSAGLWVKRAHKVIKDIVSSGKCPIIVGGTGFYIKALLYGLSDIPNISAAVVKDVYVRFKKLGSSQFHKILLELDPAVTDRIHPGDTYRMIRAMEVFTQTGRSITSFGVIKSEYEAVHININPNRGTLYQNCDARFTSMLKGCALQEATRLRDKIQNHFKNFNQEVCCRYNIENTYGYLSLVKYLDGECSLEEAIVSTQQATRKYAKRQSTWFRNQFPNKTDITYTSSVHEIRDKFIETVETSRCILY